jgi:hypothetical protein
LTTNDRDVRELWAEYLTWITAEVRRRSSDMTLDATTRLDHEMAQSAVVFPARTSCERHGRRTIALHVRSAVAQITIA